MSGKPAEASWPQLKQEQMKLQAGAGGGGGGKEGGGSYRHDANLALSRLDDARAVGPYQPGARLLLQAPLDLDHVMLRDACHCTCVCLSVVTTPHEPQLDVSCCVMPVLADRQVPFRGLRWPVRSRRALGATACWVQTCIGVKHDLAAY